MTVRGIFQVSGLEDYLEAIRSAGRDVDIAAGEAVDAGAQIVFDDAQENAPVLEGKLQAEVYRTGVQSDGNYVYVMVGVDENADLPYESYIEYGTARASAQPFFRPAIDKNKSRVSAAEKKVLQAHGVPV